MSGRTDGFTVLPAVGSSERFFSLLSSPPFINAHQRAPRTLVGPLRYRVLTH